MDAYGLLSLYVVSKVAGVSVTVAVVAVGKCGHFRPARRVLCLVGGGLGLVQLLLSLAGPMGDCGRFLGCRVSSVASVVTRRVSLRLRQFGLLLQMGRLVSGLRRGRLSLLKIES